MSTYISYNNNCAHPMTWLLTTALRLTHQPNMMCVTWFAKKSNFTRIECGTSAADRGKRTLLVSERNVSRRDERTKRIYCHRRDGKIFRAQRRIRHNREVLLFFIFFPIDNWNTSKWRVRLRKNGAPGRRRFNIEYVRCRARSSH